MTADQVLDTAWQEQSRWSQTAGKLKRSLELSRNVILVSLVLGAVLGTLAAQLGAGTRPQRLLAAAAAAVIAVPPLLRGTKVGKEAVANWTRARSVSEAIKHEVYRYRTGTGDYRADPGARATTLGRKLEAVVAEVGDLDIHAAGVEPADRPAPGPLDMAGYLDERVGQQVDTYYRPRARDLARKARNLRWAEFSLALLAALLSAATAAAEIEQLVGWVAAVTTIAGALLAHREASRYEDQVVSYSMTARRLSSLRTKWAAKLAAGALPPADEDALVNECEAAISVENQSWMAGWTDAPAG